MWYLVEDQPERPPAPRYWLGGVAHTRGRSIGRKHVDIRLKASSVSRTHAKLVVQKAPFYAHPHPHRHTTTVTVYDSSAYGTFLKYPQGHPAARDSMENHIRLDKNTPTQIFDGALLSFGAPAAWWRLVWHPLLVIPAHLSDAERSRLAVVAADTGIEVADKWVENATHLVTTRCKVHSVKFMTALASRAHVVTPSWIEAIHHVVTQACRAIGDAPNSDAADMTTRLPDERRFIPEFEPSDLSTHGADVLSTVFSEAAVKQRDLLFFGIVLIFTQEKRRARWAKVIELCSGHAMLVTDASLKEFLKVGMEALRSFKNPNLDSCQRIICIVESATNVGSTYLFTEAELYSSLLKADLEPFDEPDPDDDQDDHNRSTIQNEDSELPSEGSPSLAKPSSSSHVNKVIKSNTKGRLEEDLADGIEHGYDSEDSKCGCQACSANKNEQCEKQPCLNKTDRSTRKRQRSMSELVTETFEEGTVRRPPISVQSNQRCKSKRRLKGSQTMIPQVHRLAASAGVNERTPTRLTRGSLARALIPPGANSPSQRDVNRAMLLPAARTNECARVDGKEIGRGESELQGEGESNLPNDSADAGVASAFADQPEGENVSFQYDADGWRERIDQPVSLEDNDRPVDARSFFVCPAVEMPVMHLTASSGGGSVDPNDVRMFHGPNVSVASRIASSSLHRVDNTEMPESEMN